MGIFAKAKSTIKNCKVCRGEFHYEDKAGKVRRCKCFHIDRFLNYARMAKVQEQYVKLNIAKEAQELFSDQPTVCVVSWSPAERRAWAHSTAFMFARHCYSVWMSQDIDVIEAVLKGAGVEEGELSLKRFLEPKALILEIGYVRNKDYIGSHFRYIIENRELAGKKTLVILPSLNSIKDRYQDEALHMMLLDDLDDRGALKKLSISAKGEGQ